MSPLTQFTLHVCDANSVSETSNCLSIFYHYALLCKKELIRKTGPLQIGTTLRYIQEKSYVYYSFDTLPHESLFNDRNMNLSSQRLAFKKCPFR